LQSDKSGISEVTKGQIQRKHRFCLCSKGSSPLLYFTNMQQNECWPFGYCSCAFIFNSSFLYL